MWEKRRYGSKNKTWQRGFARQRGPLGALKFHDSKTKKLGLSRLPCNFSVLSGGSDEIRTRDLRRDRRKVQLMISMCCVTSGAIQVVS